MKMENISVKQREQRGIPETTKYKYAFGIYFIGLAFLN